MNKTTDKTESKDNQYIIHSVDKALKILDLLCSHDKLTAAEVASMTGYGKSTAFRLLSTLEHNEYVMKDENARYSLGIRLYSIQNVIIGRNLLGQYLRPYLKQLADMTGETCHLSQLINSSENRYIECVKGNSVLKADSAVGFNRPLYATASGRVILAAQTDEFIRQYADNVSFKAYTPASIKSVSELMEHIQSAREKGYSVNDERFEAGLTSYAAAVTDAQGTLLGAISVSGPSERLRANRELCVDSLLEIIKQIRERKIEI